MADNGYVDAVGVRKGDKPVFSIERPHPGISFAACAAAGESGGMKKKKVEKYNIFLVEDDPDDRLLALKTLRQSVYIQDIQCFRSGDKLIEHFVNEGYYSGNLLLYMPTIILLDIHIPGTNGIEILKKLKEHPVTSDIPVVIITVDDSNEMINKARQLKANAFVTKPLNLEQIHQVIYTGWGWPDGLPPDEI